MFSALLAILKVPSSSLLRVRGGMKHKAVRSLLRNLRGLATRSVSSVASQQPHSAVPESSDPAARLGRARALIQQGHLGRATKSLFQLPLPVVDEKVLPSLQDLHPASSGTAAPLPVDAPLLQVVDLDALSSIVRSSLANGAAPGGSGWTGDLLKALIGDQDAFMAWRLLPEISLTVLSPGAPESSFSLVYSLLLGSPMVVSDRLRWVKPSTSYLASICFPWCGKTFLVPLVLCNLPFLLVVLNLRF